MPHRAPGSQGHGPGHFLQGQQIRSYRPTGSADVRQLMQEGLGFYRVATLERGLVAGLVAMLVGVGLLLAAVYEWRQADFGRLDYARTMRLVVPGATLTALAFQTILSSFFVSILGMKRR